MSIRQTMDNCPQDDTLRLIWFDKRSIPWVCLYMDKYAFQGHHGWWSVDPRSGGMEPVWGEPREWQEIATETAVVVEPIRTVECPICHHPDMVCTPETDGEPDAVYIDCTNVTCPSNSTKRKPHPGTHNWVQCPICKEEDMRCEAIVENGVVIGANIKCVNTGCTSNQIPEGTI